MPYESGNELVSVSEEKKNVFDRSQYAEILNELILSQQKQYKNAKDNMKKNKISHNLGYLIQVMSSLINSEKNLDQRIEQLEKLAGITKKGVITK